MRTKTLLFVLILVSLVAVGCSDDSVEVSADAGADTRGDSGQGDADADEDDGGGVDVGQDAVDTSTEDAAPEVEFIATITATETTQTTITLQVVITDDEGTPTPMPMRLRYGTAADNLDVTRSAFESGFDYSTHIQTIGVSADGALTPDTDYYVQAFAPEGEYTSTVQGPFRTDAAPISATGLPLQGRPTGDQRLPLADPPLETWITGDFTGIEYLRLEPQNSHQYSKRQAFDFDERWVSFGQTVVDLENGYAEKSSRVSRESAWSHTTPGVLYGLQWRNGDRTLLLKYDVNTEVLTEIDDFTRYRSVSLGKNEGSISNDDKYMVFVGTLADGSREIFSYDLETQSVVATMPAGANLDFAGVSQRGQYVLVSLSPDNPNKLLRYNMDLTDETLLTNDVQHGDFCIDAAGDEVYAMVGIQPRWVRLRDGEEFTHNLAPKNWGHISCRNYKRPGWAYISVHDDDIQFIGAIELVPGADQMEAWVFPRESDISTRATASPSGRMVCFSSNWAGGSEFIARTTL